MVSRLIMLLALLLTYTWQTHQYVRVWQSDLTLWTHAARVAPLKPRPYVNLGVALILAGQFGAARAAFEHAEAVAQLPHVPVWDRQDAQRAAAANLRALERLERQ